MGAVHYCPGVSITERAPTGSAGYTLGIVGLTLSVVTAATVVYAHMMFVASVNSANDGQSLSDVIGGISGAIVAVMIIGSVILLLPVALALGILAIIFGVSAQVRGAPQRAARAGWICGIVTVVLGVAAIVDTTILL